IDCLIKEARVNGVKLLSEFGVKDIEIRNDSKDRFLIKLRAGESLIADRILIATGGNPNDDSYNWLKQLGHKILKPVPSLFTFNVPNSRLNGLQGLSVKNAIVKIAGSNFEEKGPLLITHWGFSGPCILRLSAWGARHLADLNYQFNISIKWVPDYNEDMLREFLIQFKEENLKKLVVSNPLFEIPKRLWERIATLSGIEDDVRWLDLPKKSMNKLIEELLRGNFSVKGKTTFKEEFVTCGGVSLAEINFKTMESKLCPGLYFAGEVLDIDGITGGFNFQAAWTTGYLAGKAMSIE
ncbi:MAG TPA: aminoacetone oxidase family FAD-binding enzyme, partial [Cytophagaceae bacterium]